MENKDGFVLAKFEKRSLLCAVCPILVFVIVTSFFLALARLSGNENVWAGYAIFVFVFFPVAVGSYVFSVIYGVNALKIRKSISAIAGISIVAIQALILLVFYLFSNLSNYS